MKFWAKVRFKGKKNAECLIRAFFRNFNSESSIVIRGKEAKVEIIFDKLPMEIIEAINQCEIIEFNCGKALRKYKENETEQVMVNEEISELIEQEEVREEISEQTKQAVVEEETSEQVEQAMAEEESSEQTEQTVAEEDNPENSKIPNKMN